MFDYLLLSAVMICFVAALLVDVGEMSRATPGTRILVAVAATGALGVSLASGSLAVTALGRGHLAGATILSLAAVVSVALTAESFKLMATKPTGPAMVWISVSLLAWTLAASFVFLMYLAGASVLG